METPELIEKLNKELNKNLRIVKDSLTHSCLDSQVEESIYSLIDLQHNVQISKEDLEILDLVLIKYRLI